MRKYIALLATLISTSAFSADWVYAVSSGTESFWIDKSFYKFDTKSKTVDVWSKSIKKNLSNEFYTGSKSLIRYSCLDKTSKILAHVEYRSDGSVSSSKTSPETKFSLIFPDSIAEGMWSIACSSKGKGFTFSKMQLERNHVLDLESRYGESGPLSEYQPEFVDLKSVGVK